MPKKLDPLKQIEDFLGIDLTTIQTPEMEAAVVAQTEFEALSDARTLEAESVVFYIETKGDQSIWKRRVCKQCGSKFLSTYTGVGLCTDECRRLFLESRGIKWNPVGRTESERWGGTIPRIIGPTATKTLQELTFPDEPEPVRETSTPVEEDDFDLDAFIKGELD